MLLKTILIIYAMCSCLLILFILMSKGKGAEIGATFNSSTNEIFGSKGSSSILNKIITFLALLVLSTNLLINVINKNEKTTNPIINIQEYKTQLSEEEQK